MANVGQQLLGRIHQLPLTVEIFKVGQLDPLPHAQNERRVTQAIHEHPDVARIQRGQLGRSLMTRMSVVLKRVSDVGPRRNDGAQNHEPEREQGQSGDRAAKPKHLAVRDQDDGEVLEDGVDRDRQKLKGFAPRVDHADKQDRDWKPYAP